jgi:hypothetical protein
MLLSIGTQLVLEQLADVLTFLIKRFTSGIEPFPAVQKRGNHSSLKITVYLMNILMVWTDFLDFKTLLINVSID